MKVEDLTVFCRKLPAFPVAMVKLLEAIKKDAFTVEEISEIISSDLALSTKMLQIANSAFYGRVTPANTINDAFMIIGLKTAKNLVLALSLNRILTVRSSDFDFDLFWRNSIAAGIASELLARIVRYSINNEYFLSGFLQDIGVIILYKHDPDTYKKVFEEKERTGDKLFLFEQRILSLDHHEAGSFILKMWGFPESIYGPISTHHDSGDMMYMDKDIFMVLNTLDVSDLVCDIYYGSKKSRKISELYNKCTEKFSLKAQDIDYFVDRVGKESVNYFSFFDVNPAGTRSYSEILRDENEHLMRTDTKYEPTVYEDGNDDKKDTEETIRQLVMTNQRLWKEALEYKV